LSAVKQGEGRIISCFLSGTEDGYPNRRKQGWLIVQSETAKWIPFWSARRQALPLEVRPLRVEVRPADKREPNVKKGGKAFGLLPVPSFVVITCVLDSGSIELVVPGLDQQLVEGFFKSRIT
jgi:hypothetical protein